MQDALLAAVTRHAPAWVRYVLTLSEIAKCGDGWVLASGDDIALLDAGGASAMPLWPYRKLAEGAHADEIATDSPLRVAQPTALGARELAEKIMPALAANGMGVAVFPGPDDNRIIGAAGVARDLRTFLDEPRDVATELATEPRQVALQGWATLDVPDSGDADPDSAARFWLLASEEGDSIIGVVTEERPAIAFFETAALAEEFAAMAGASTTPRPASTNSLIGHWLLLAFTAQWQAAIVTEDGGSGMVEPVRLALDLATAVHRATTG